MHYQKQTGQPKTPVVIPEFQQQQQQQQIPPRPPSTSRPTTRGGGNNNTTEGHNFGFRYSGNNNSNNIQSKPTSQPSTSRSNSPFQLNGSIKRPGSSATSHSASRVDDIVVSAGSYYNRHVQQQQELMLSFAEQEQIELRSLPWWKRAVLDQGFRKQLLAGISSAHRLLEEHASSLKDGWDLPATDRGKTVHISKIQVSALDCDGDGNIRHITRTTSGPRVSSPRVIQQSHHAGALLIKRGESLFSKNTQSELDLLDIIANKNYKDIALSRGNWIPYSISNRAPGDGPTYRWMGGECFPPCGFHISYTRIEGTELEQLQGGILVPPTVPSFETIGTPEAPASQVFYSTKIEYPLLGGVLVPKDIYCVYLVSDATLGNNLKNVIANNNNNNVTEENQKKIHHPKLLSSATRYEMQRHQKKSTEIIKTVPGGVRYQLIDREDPMSIIRRGGTAADENDQQQPKKKKPLWNIPIISAEEEERRKKNEPKKLFGMFTMEEMKQAAEEEKMRQLTGEEQKSPLTLKKKASPTKRTKVVVGGEGGKREEDEDDEEEEEEEMDGEEDENNVQKSASIDPSSTASHLDKTQKRRKKKLTAEEKMKEKFKGLLPSGSVGFSFGSPKFFAYLWPSHRLLRFRLLSASLLTLAQEERDPSIAEGFTKPSDPLASYVRADLSDSRIEFLFSSEPCRESVQKIFDKLPKDAHNRLEQRGFISFTLDLYNLYMPLHSDRANLILAEAEWAARGILDDSLDFLLFYWFFFDVPLFLIRSFGNSRTNKFS
jgi:hypothetical protein